MGFGKKKRDAAEILGRLSVMPWDQEPLTEVKPLSRDVESSPEMSKQRTTVSTVEPDTE